MERIIFLPGEKVSLVVPEESDIEVMYKGMNDINISQFVGPAERYTKPMEKESLGEMMNGKYHFFMIYENSSKKIIGGLGFNDLSQLHRNAVVGIALYDKEIFGKGYGSEALKLLLQYGFVNLGLHKISLKLLARNTRALKSYQKCGFQEVGYFKENKYVMGKYEDEIQMEIMKREWEEGKE